MGALAPHLQAGGSAALALTARCRALVELVSDFSVDGATVALGTSLKWALGPRTAMALGALLPLDGNAVSGALQLSQSL
ncbi:hypothetical protein [Anaeromyxobacter paludicola]|uniref:Uncharacterized protein n=1 Tax=Anaeromyxobacter paludicola TaxID=2918171 RepID=A0ABN6N986_9BACT|nr:hypothetical protein [Anaeromyxobacter paludicola]BDG09792.1 hypothetical protein AMPC_29050 [Anaeromyxobacter paludicola]